MEMLNKILITMNLKNSLKKIKDDASQEKDLRAVKQNGSALKFVKEQTQEICLAAVKQYPDAEEFVKDKSMLDSSESVKDSLVEREVNGKKVRIKEVKFAEAQDFIKKNPGFSAIYEEDGKVYLALEDEE